MRKLHGRPYCISYWNKHIKVDTYVRLGILIIIYVQYNHSACVKLQANLFCMQWNLTVNVVASTFYIII